MTREPERLTIFHVDKAYYFTHYFERTDLFRELRDFYDGDTYRFEVADSEWDGVADTLRAAHYEPAVVEDVEPYCVVTETYDEHANVLRNSVLNWERRDHRFFVVKDALSVEKAIEDGATPVEETEFAVGI